MKVVVQDASVLIDLVACDLLELWCRLGFDTLTTSLVWREVNRKHQKTRLQRIVERGDIRIVPIGAEVLTHIVQLQTELASRISLEDASVLYIASSREAILLTSDRVLRRCAEERAIEVHGLLWVFDLLVARGRMLPGVAADRLDQFAGRETSRLPESEWRQRIRKWRSQ